MAADAVRRSLAGFWVMASAAVVLLYTGGLFVAAPGAIAVQAGAVALMLWARATLGWRSFHAAADPTEGELVTRGPYRFVRHPIYAALGLFCAAGAFAKASWPALGAWGVLVAGAALRMRCEERLLAALYRDYADYAASTKRVVPFLF